MHTCTPRPLETIRRDFSGTDFGSGGGFVIFQFGTCYLIRIKSGTYYTDSIGGNKSVRSKIIMFNTALDGMHNHVTIHEGGALRVNSLLPLAGQISRWMSLDQPVVSEAIGLAAQSGWQQTILVERHDVISQ